MFITAEFMYLSVTTYVSDLCPSLSLTFTIKQLFKIKTCGKLDEIWRGRKTC